MGHSFDLVMRLVRNPCITDARVQPLLGVSNPTVRSVVNVLAADWLRAINPDLL